MDGQMKPIPRLRKFSFVIFVLPLLLLHACASTRFSAGEQKNSMPLMEKDMLENVHSIVVAPFFGDSNNWSDVVRETLTARALSLIPAGNANFSTLGPYGRREALVKLGRSLRADAVMNGILLNRDGRGEIIIQLISTKDSRVLFWQAADFTQKEGPIDPVAQREFLSGMLKPVLAHAAKKEAPPEPLASQQPRTEAPTRPEADMRPGPAAPSKIEKKPKVDRRRDRDRELTPAPPSEEISPM
jgi:hypothetical protein